MEAFLEQVAGKFHSLYGSDIGGLCFVFPNRRSSLFFRKYLGQMTASPVFCPTLLTINDLFIKLSGLRQVDRIEALWILYRRYSALMWPDGSPQESFDEFIYWGDILLGDFDDVDKYMADARLLYANIKDINEIDAGYDFLSPSQRDAIRQFWGDFLLNPLSESRLDKKRLFRDTWSILYPLYCGFREELLSRGMAYEGMMYRIVAESIGRDSALRDGVVEKLRSLGPIVFVGLNALNRCEKRLLSLVRDTLGGDFYWDFEGRMVTDSDNKSSLFMRDNVRDYPSLHPLSPCRVPEQHYTTVAVPSAAGQTAVVCGILEELASREGFDASQTAIILPDESLLEAMLNSVPQSIQDINVTMGYPMGLSNVCTFVTMIDRLHRNRRMKDGKCRFYHRDVMPLLEHPFIKDSISSESENGAAAVEDFRRRMRNENLIYVQSDDLSSLSPLLGLVFRPVGETAELSSYIISIMDAVQGSASRVDREFLYHLHAAVNRLDGLKIPMKEESFFKLLGQLVSTKTIPFRGEPLKGLQIMGPLETRALDFQNVIILSVNEGIFPKRSVSGSFIPYNLRLGFGLPNYEFQDSISAYHFYRSIYRAENIILLYDSRSEGMQSGESSRYIKQLKYHYDIPLDERTVSCRIGCGGNGETSVQKDENVLNLLRNKYINGNKVFSATSLNQYLDCPLKFYYGSVAGIGKAEEVSEGMEADTFGTIFHKVMEMIYSPFIGKVLSSDDLEKLLRDRDHISALTAAAFLEEGGIREITGRNLLAKRLIEKYVMKVLEVDRGRTPFTVAGIEKSLSASMDVNVDGSPRPVRLFGKADRMDLRGGVTAIIDYKSGTVKNKWDFKRIDELFTRNASRPSIAFQLCLYSLMAVQTFAGGTVEDYLPTVYPLRDLFGGAPSERAITGDELELFRARLSELLDQIFDPEVPFAGCTDIRTCQYCDFRKLCGR